LQLGVEIRKGCGMMVMQRKKQLGKSICQTVNEEDKSFTKDTGKRERMEDKNREGIMFRKSTHKMRMR
jgi:hypothetical protein